MKITEPAILLCFWIFLPMGSGDFNYLLAQIFLSEIKAAHIARRAEQNLSLDPDNNSEQAFKDFLSALWFAPGNTTAYAYFEVMNSYLDLFNPQNANLITNTELTPESD
ncbi:hypothetical protein ACL6C3_04530 [Capilliphycus salinus ALCB114379]|uniref:hypothetical protein n=1 Tax=Capilliphycus salinus TaxID=2768948 RepID=UPI0039A7771F